MTENANSSGQGFDTAHVCHALHATVTAFGYLYSHSTPVVHGNGDRIIHHTYRRNSHTVSVWNFGVHQHPRWSTGNGRATGYCTTGEGAASLTGHLKSKARHYRELRDGTARKPLPGVTVAELQKRGRETFMPSRLDFLVHLLIARLNPADFGFTRPTDIVRGGWAWTYSDKINMESV